MEHMENSIQQAGLEDDDPMSQARAHHWDATLAAAYKQVADAMEVELLRETGTDSTRKGAARRGTEIREEALPATQGEEE